MEEEHIPWWEHIYRCHAKTKNGKRCKLPARQAYEIKPGYLFIPLTCHKHKKQENKIRKKAGTTLMEQE